MKGPLHIISALLLVSQALGDGTIYPCPTFGTSRLQHSTSCDRYVQCFAGAAVVRDCAPGLQYSESIAECMSPSEAQCYLGQNPCPLYNDPSNVTYIQDDVECGKYYLCYNNKMHEYSCAPGLHWDNVNQYCAYPEDAECEIYEIICPEGGGNVAHPYICNRFYQCLNDRYYPNTCPDGLLFDTNIMNCNLPEISVCASESGGTTTTTTVTTPSTTESTTIPTTTEAPFDCPEHFEVFEHPSKGCQWYIVCENGEPFEGECPLYTAYNDRLAICKPGIC